MSYETLKKLTVNLKELKVKYAYSSSNVRDWRDRIIVNEVEREFESKEKLEDFLLGLVSGHYDGCTRISRALTLYKRIQYLEEHDLIENYMAKDTEEVRKILTGEKKVKVKQFVMMTDDGSTLKTTKYGVRLFPKSYGVKPSKLYKSDVDTIKACYKSFIEQHNVKEVEVV